MHVALFVLKKKKKKNYVYIGTTDWVQGKIKEGVRRGPGICILMGCGEFCDVAAQGTKWMAENS